MSDRNKAVLQQANAAILRGDTEGFLAHCTGDVQWTAVGEPTLDGKEAVRRWMATAYRQPPQFTVARMVAEGDTVVALGSITTRDADGRPQHHAYADVWRFREGRMASLEAFVIAVATTGA